MNQASEAVMLYVTVPDMAQAKQLANGLVSERLAACANILPAMQSVYWWDGEVQQGDEVVLLVKTTAALQNEAIAWLTNAHSYDCPCVVAFPIIAGNQHFLAWIRQEVK